MFDNHDFALVCCVVGVLNKKTNEDGTYEIKVIPGNYDVLIDKVAYLDYIVTTIQVNEIDEIDLDNVELIPR